MSDFKYLTSYALRCVTGSVAIALLASCGSHYIASATSIESLRTAAARSQVYQPLAVGDSWRYLCNHQFSVENVVLATVRVAGRVTYEFSIQIPNSPTHSVKVVQLLATDSNGTTRIYGYLLHGKIKKVTPTAIVVPSPVLNAHYNYPSPYGSTINRVFVGFESTNPTPLGTFWVAPYFESNATHNYGYTLGRGIMEEDHGPHYEFDCLIDRITVR